VTRSRGLLLAAAVLIVILVVQMITSIVGAVIAQRQATAAAQDTFSYVGDLTAERVARYAGTAQDLVATTASSIEGHQSEFTTDEVLDLLYSHLDHATQVRGAFVGFPDGRFVSVSHKGTGYAADVVEVEPEYSVMRLTYDSQFKMITSTPSDLVYDPRIRPWYTAGAATLNTVWTDPYIQFDSNVTFASATRAARNSSGLQAVVAADLDLSKMGEVLDTLPVGDDAEAFVLSRDRHVIAAPTEYSDHLEEIARTTGEVPLATDIGVGPEAAIDGYADGDVFGEVDGRISLERGFPPADQLTWVLHLEADESALSSGLDKLQLTIYVVTALSAISVAGVGFLMYRVWHPLRKLTVRAHTDQLTGLLNRHAYRSQGASLLRRALARGEIAVVVAFDLDNFKWLNDQYGHEAGDAALSLVADVLTDASRDGDVVARTGGDEFVMVQVIPDMSYVPRVVERVREVVSNTVRTQALGGAKIGITAGYSVTREGMFDLDTLMAEADSALLAGKRTGKGATYRHGHLTEPQG